MAGPLNVAGGSPELQEHVDQQGHDSIHQLGSRSLPSTVPTAARCYQQQLDLPHRSKLQRLCGIVCHARCQPMPELARVGTCVRMHACRRRLQPVCHTRRAGAQRPTGQQGGQPTLKVSTPQQLPRYPGVVRGVTTQQLHGRVRKGVLVVASRSVAEVQTLEVHDA